MEQDSSIVRQAAWLLHVARFLERIADHAVNVAERVYYVETGELKTVERKTRPDSNGKPPI
jgi:phosphate transport system protein